jgi:ribosomal protein S18 acetylase RimI-like enzyme
LREQGARVAAERALARVGVRAALVLEQRLPIGTPPADAPDPSFATFAEATERDASAVATLYAPEPARAVPRASERVHTPDAPLRSEPDRSQALRDRLARGERCFVGRRDGHVVAAAWVARGMITVSQLPCELVLQPGETYLYDSYVNPSVRSRGLASALYAHIGLTLGQEGVSRNLMLVRPTNTANLRAARRAGYERVGLLARVPGLGVQSTARRRLAFR